MTSEQAQQTQQTANAMPGFTIMGQTLNLIDILYLGLLIFFAYQTFKSYRMRKSMTDPKFVYSGQTGIMNLVLTIMIIGFGIMTLFMDGGRPVTGVLMILLGIVFYISTSGKIVVSQQGLFADNKFITWKELRKWAWDVKGKCLVVITKQPGKPQERLVMRVGNVNMGEINDKIRFFKLGKLTPEQRAAAEAEEQRWAAEETLSAEAEAKDEKPQQTGLKGTSKHKKK
ncbi:MAG: hypothetical protein PUJ57_05680 [Peptoniphilaceae bacterium]|nr:hypothetical protein [Peptoniphilaceae bacterium]MDY6085633.1 hypothetical protein [Peptoniphilaceae bacterium]